MVDKGKFDFDAAREKAKAVMARAKLYLPALCFGHKDRAERLSKAMDNPDSDECVAALCMMSAVYDLSNKGEPHPDGNLAGAAVALAVLNEETQEQQHMRQQFIDDLWFIVRRLRDMKAKAQSYGVLTEISSAQSRLSGALGKLESKEQADG